MIFPYIIIPVQTAQAAQPILFKWAEQPGQSGHQKRNTASVSLFFCKSISTFKCTYCDVIFTSHLHQNTNLFAAILYVYTSISLYMILLSVTSYKLHLLNSPNTCQTTGCAKITPQTGWHKMTNVKSAKTDNGERPIIMCQL